MATRPQKDQRLNLRIEEGDRVLFDTVARARRETLTQFLVESGRERAERLLADRHRFVLHPDQFEALLEAMDRPAQVQAELADLLTRARPE